MSRQVLRFNRLAVGPALCATQHGLQINVVVRPVVPVIRGGLAPTRLHVPDRPSSPPDSIQDYAPPHSRALRPTHPVHPPCKRPESLKLCLKADLDGENHGVMNHPYSPPTTPPSAQCETCTKEGPMPTTMSKARIRKVCPHARGALVGATRKGDSGMVDANGSRKAPMRGFLFSCRRRQAPPLNSLVLFLTLGMAIRVVTSGHAALFIKTASTQTSASEEERLQYDNGGDVAAKEFYSDTFWTPGAGAYTQIDNGGFECSLRLQPRRTSPHTTQQAPGNLMGHGVNHDASLESKAPAESEVFFSFWCQQEEVMVHVTTTHRRLLAHDLASDTQALLAVKSAISNPGRIFHSWTVDGHPCTFAHVSCNGGRVTGLQLIYLDLSGTVATELGSLTALTNLDLSHNSLSGVIPPELGSLASLRYLDLSWNRLSGVIPSELGSLASLQQLDLSLNIGLSGVIPLELATLASLQYLFLSYNRLTGVIPPELGSLASLYALELNNNNLNGIIPPELGSLASLWYLELSLNSLSGVIPPELGSLASLQQLYLFINNLSGAIPPELGSLSSLQFLDSHLNRLNGFIPPELGSLASLIRMNLFENNLSGTIPRELGSLAFMGWLSLFDNNLSGTIPPELGSLASLQQLRQQQPGRHHSSGAGVIGICPLITWSAPSHLSWAHYRTRDSSMDDRICKPLAALFACATKNDGHEEHAVPHVWTVWAYTVYRLMSDE
eukprot:jgi/Mesvir1/4305/Mv06375-RA.1